MSAQMDSLSSCLNPSLFCFAPPSLGSCKAAESHLGRVACPQHGRDQHPLGNAPIRVHEAGQEHLAAARLAGGEPGWLWPAASSLRAAGEVSEAPSGRSMEGLPRGGAAGSARGGCSGRHLAGKTDPAGGWGSRTGEGPLKVKAQSPIT